MKRIYPEITSIDSFSSLELMEKFIRNELEALARLSNTHKAHNRSHRIPAAEIRCCADAHGNLMRQFQLLAQMKREAAGGMSLPELLQHCKQFISTQEATSTPITSPSETIISP